jgi:superfamily I DNA/RNA helicase
LDRRIDRAIGALEDGLKPTWWTDQDTLAAKGNKVFDADKQVVKELTKEPLASNPYAANVVQSVLESDRSQAATAIANALARGHTRTNRAHRSLIAWALPYATTSELRAAIAAARQQRAALRQDDADLILATAHGTKGLEFDHVAVIGMDEHVFPSRRTLEDSDDPKRALEEERRLAYVAWTRARKSLTLVYDPTAPSTFMREAFSPAELGLPA